MVGTSGSAATGLEDGKLVFPKVVCVKRAAAGGRRDCIDIKLFGFSVEMLQGMVSFEGYPSR